MMMPLLIAYKLKFFTLIPIFIGKVLLFLKVYKLLMAMAFLYLYKTQQQHDEHR